MAEKPSVFLCIIHRQEVCIMIGQASFIVVNPATEVRIVGNTLRLIKMSAAFAATGE